MCIPDLIVASLQVLFDTSKKEMLNPNQGYKKIVQKLKSRYKVRKTSLESLTWLCFEV